MLLREVSILLITWIGFDTHSQLVTQITNGVFIAQFFNTAILILLVNANFGELSSKETSFFDGPFYDYSPDWYSNVGLKIVQTMIINAILPLVTEVVPILWTWMLTRHDQGWESDPVKRLYQTKTT